MGGFRISCLPPGEYTLAAVHEKFGEQTLRVKVSAKEAAKADFFIRGAVIVARNSGPCPFGLLLDALLRLRFRVRAITLR